ncbi:hypothetical protein B0H63DRAFT_451746 [Podospora didyma]|uniref:Uncharacterized protein n=1 Tax=Podospora didyma TaxID=330526 RepID=A0AAE0KK36_9PEZI|nr:hypothetical protein B0H63DRAFT_451746 [Podospora didyma]
MQRIGATPTQPAAPFFASLFSGGGSSSGNNLNGSSSSPSKSHRKTPSKSLSFSKSPSKSRPGTSSGEPGIGQQPGQGPGDSSPQQQRQPNVLHKERDRDRRPSFGRKASFSSSSPNKGGSRRRAESSANANANGGNLGFYFSSASLTSSDDPAIPPLPEFSLSAAAKLSRESDAIASPALSSDGFKMLSRTATTPVNGFSSTSQLAPPAQVTPGQPSELSVLHQHIQETANKRISTLDYLRKAHEGRVYWFNTLLFDKPDLARMPYFDSRKLARRATNYLLLGISLPTVTDLNSNNPVEFLRSLNTLLSEFESFQQLHSENGGTSSSSLSRARLPQMFRRATPGYPGKGRRSSSATDSAGYPTLDSSDNPADDNNHHPFPADPISAAAAAPASVINFASSEVDLLPGEEYTHLLTPTLPFDPDFFETFATLCDVLIDTYTRFLSLVPTPRECGGSVAELFTKADSKVRKLLVQGVIKEFEDASRTGAKTEVANVGKVVLGGLM